MASVAAASLALFDAGVPLAAPVGGLAIGLYHNDGDWHKTSRTTTAVVKPWILTDQMGIEDHFGDMDLKVTGSSTGFTALHLDLKIPGITVALLERCIHKAREGLDQVLAAMNSVLPKPRAQFKSTVPAKLSLKLTELQRASLFGRNRLKADAISAQTGVQVSYRFIGLSTIMISNV